jgi:hypothetical protein
VQFQGTHHGDRPDDFINAVAVFLFNLLKCGQLEFPVNLLPKLPKSNLMNHLEVPIIIGPAF